MSKYVLLICIIALASCSRLYPQSVHPLDSVFNTNLSVLDSVSRGLKDRRELTQEQSSFLFLIDGWVDSKTSFNHSEGIVFGVRNVETWRLWYQKHYREIDEKEFYSALKILLVLSKNGTVPESDLDYLEELNKKYRRLSGK